MLLFSPLQRFFSALPLPLSFTTMQLSLSIVALAITTTFTSASPLAKRDVTVNFDSRVFINKGLVGFVSGGKVCQLHMSLS